MVPRIRAGFLGLSCLAFGGSMIHAQSSEGVTSVARGWDNESIKSWSYGTQGSRLMPLMWFEALEQPDSTLLFSDIGYLTKFGYLRPPAWMNERRPIGFAVDEQSDAELSNTQLRWFKGQRSKEKWIGFNCAACHTAQIDTDKGSYQLHGAPGMGDFQSLVLAINNALMQTLAQEAKFDRFAARVLIGRDTVKNREMLKSALGKLVEYQGRIAGPNQVSDPYGFARVDAIGYIFNKSLVLANPGTNVIGNPTNAPVSYPFLWNISKQHQVQWNGMVTNERIKLPRGTSMDVGALGRNAGEVIGVFGDVQPKKGFVQRVFGGVASYHSSVRVNNLNLLEETLTRLDSPVWGNVIGTPIDAAKAGRGKDLFDAQCASCHVPREKWEEGKPIERMSSLNSLLLSGDLTDTQMACNAYNNQGPTGKLKGARINPTKKQRHGEVSSVADILTTLVSAVLVRQVKNIAEAALDNIYRPGKLPVVDGDKALPPPPMVVEILEVANPEAPPPLDLACINAQEPDPKNPGQMRYTNGYKARPLDGIWATSPYLHNGSVPTLYHLLKAPEDRPDNWWVGDRSFDTTMVGYQWNKRDGVNQSNFRKRTPSGAWIVGNDNKGHDYGASKLSEEDRWALVEYMKTL